MLFHREWALNSDQFCFLPPVMSIQLRSTVQVVKGKQIVDPVSIPYSCEMTSLRNAKKHPPSDITENVCSIFSSSSRKHAENGANIVDRLPTELASTRWHSPGSQRGNLPAGMSMLIHDPGSSDIGKPRLFLFPYRGSASA